MRTGVFCIALCAVLGCGGSPPQAPRGPVYAIVTTESTGIPIVVVNHTASTISSLELVSFPPAGGRVSDKYPTALAPSEKAELRVNPAMLNNNELLITIRAGTEVLVTNDRPYVVTGPLQIDVVDDESRAVPPPAGFTSDVRLTVKGLEAKRANEAAQFEAEQAALCQKTVDAAHVPPKPSKKLKKLTGTFKCEFSGAFSGTADVKITQKAGGAISATVSEVAGAVTTNTTWEGVIVGTELRFAYKDVNAGGALEIDPKAKTLTGGGTSLTDSGCVSWQMTCTK